MNGAAYDPWMNGLLDASPSKKRTVIAVAKLMGYKPGSDPHLGTIPSACRSPPRATFPLKAVASKN
jgi:hypothetical protein